MKRAPEEHRNKKYSNRSYGNNGVFFIPHYRIDDYEFRCIISDGAVSNGKAWEHVSVEVCRKGKLANRCPTWEEMSWIKEQFWHDDEVVIQFHPAKADYVNIHPFVLHLWKPVNTEFITPPKIMV